MDIEGKRLRKLRNLDRIARGWRGSSTGSSARMRGDAPLYAMRQVLSRVVLMFACRIDSLRGLDRVTEDARFRDNWNVFSRARREMVICSHQVTNVLAAMDANEIAARRPRLLKTLHHHHLCLANRLRNRSR